jgi:HK97 family phage prohead protease
VTMTISPEARAYRVALEVRDVEVTGRPARYLEGRAVPYEVFADVGWFVEQHAADSFKKSTTGGTGKNLPLLLFHNNRSFPIGHAESWTHEGGLNGVWKLNGSPESDRAADAAAAGDLVGLSVGFMPVRSDWVYVEDWNPDLGPEYKDKVTRQESRLLEVSLTPTPVFVDAEVSVVRSAFDLETRAQQAHARAVSAVDAWRELVDALRSAPSD